MKYHSTLLTHVGFRNNTPVYYTAQDGQISRHVITAGEISLAFDMTQRYCAGWHDLETGEDSVCPTAATVDAKYEQCPACKQRTGFNPAFYHAATVSPQQERRNQQPHCLYLAYFAPGYIKVGISYAGRGQSRLLEQGARAALVLATFPSALVARSHEARIATLDGIYETLTHRTKRTLLTDNFDASAAQTELAECVTTIQRATNVEYQPTFYSFDDAYFFGETCPLSDIISRDDAATIAGNSVAMIGPDLITNYDGRLLVINLKKFVGYPLVANNPSTINLPPQQTQLF